MKKSDFLALAPLTVFATLLLCSSCNKNIDPIDPETNLDTIFPTEYIPAYPGSWWKYSDGSQISADNYVECNYMGRIGRGDCPIRGIERISKNETFYAPLYDGLPLYNTSRSIPTYGTCHLVPLVDLDAKKQEHSLYVKQGVESFYFDESLDTTVTIGNTVFHHVRVTKSYEKRPGAEKYWIDSIFTRSLYAPGVGLIRKEIKNIGSPIQQIDLTDYHINR